MPYLHIVWLQSLSKHIVALGHVDMDALKRVTHNDIMLSIAAFTQSGMILSFAKSPPPITLPALAVEIATLSSLKNYSYRNVLLTLNMILSWNRDHIHLTLHSLDSPTPIPYSNIPYQLLHSKMT